MNTSIFIEKSKKIHGNKYDYSECKYVNSHTKVVIICPEHGRFEQLPYNHLSGKGCVKCAKIKAASSLRLKNDEFLKRANSIHNGKYEYNDLSYKNYSDKINIICPIHGIFRQSVLHHLGGSGCPICSKKIGSDKKKIKFEDFVNLCRDNHSINYIYSQSSYENRFCNNNNIKIICPKHGEFIQDASGHRRGYNCPKCSIEKSKKKICNFGINDCLYEEKNIMYKVWSDMIYRCYSDFMSTEAYKNVKICDEWRLLSNFKKWFDENYIEGYTIDKDILQYDKKYKVYSPETCLFVPRYINSMIVSCNSKYGKYLKGVDKSKKRYTAHSSLGNNKKYIGIYKTEEEAFMAYKKCKEDYIKSVATKYYNNNLITKKCYEGLCNYEILKML